MMFKNRSFLVKVVKDESGRTLEESERTLGESRSDLAGSVDDLAKIVTQSAILIIAAYMGADTLRQVIVHTAQTVIQES